MLEQPTAHRVEVGELLIGIIGHRFAEPDSFPKTLGHLSTDVFVTDDARSVFSAGGLPVLLTRAAEPVS